MRATHYEETDTAVIVLREAGPDTVGEIAGENLETGVTVPGVVLHKDDAGELYRIEIYSRASGWTWTGSISSACRRRPRPRRKPGSTPIRPSHS